MNLRKKSAPPPLKPGQCGACGWLHGPEDECPIADIGYAEGFKPPSLEGKVTRDRETWNAYMRDRRAKQKARKIAAANVAAPAVEPDTVTDDEDDGYP